jgi:hypothetical protein
MWSKVDHVNRVFFQFCDEMGSEHQSFLFHTEVRWLSRGRVLSRVHESKDELKVFFEGNSQYSAMLEDNYWLQKMAYLAGIFEYLNELNRKM